MSTHTDKLRQAIERAMARIGCPPGDNSDADLYRELQSALSELEAPPSQTDDLEARAREWWLKTIMLVDETTRPDTNMALSRSASADQATEMLAAFARSLSQPSAPTVDQITLEGEQSDPCGTITVKVRMSDGREVEAIRTNANSIYHMVTVADPAFGK